MRITKAQLQEDVDFLLDRAARISGDIRFVGTPRQTGHASDELVRFAYTGEHGNYWPVDVYDYAACVRAVVSLPGHRATERVYAKMHEAEQRMKGRR